jgi:hypothetical protein
MNGLRRKDDATKTDAGITTDNTKKERFYGVPFFVIDFG